MPKHDAVDQLDHDLRNARMMAEYGDSHEMRTAGALRVRLLAARIRALRDRNGVS